MTLIPHVMVNNIKPPSAAEPMYNIPTRVGWFIHGVGLHRCAQITVNHFNGYSGFNEIIILFSYKILLDYYLSKFCILFGNIGIKFATLQHTNNF